MRDSAVKFAKRIMPDSFVHWYRRQRAGYRYIQSLGDELVDRNTRMDLEDVDERVAEGRQGFYERLAKEVLERTEVVLQELDRKIEGVAAREGNEIRALRAEVESLREEIRKARTNH